MQSSTKNNFLVVLMSQAVSMGVSILRSLVLPLFLTVAHFGYFQTYLLYISYAPLLCIGYNDGVYLRYGNKNYDSLPSRLLSKSNILFVILLVCFSLIINLISLPLKDGNIQFILRMSSIYMIFLGINTLIMQIYQITLKFKNYSVMSISARLLSLVLILALLLTGVSNYKYVVYLDLLSFVIITIYLIIANKELFSLRESPFDKVAIHELGESVSCGFSLMIANIMGMLILGIGQFAIQFFGSIEEFAQYRFGVSISSFVLMAISSASMVLYPVLKRMGEERQKDSYSQISKVLDLSIILIVPLYYICEFMINRFYPQYVGLNQYLGFLLCIVFFQAKVYILQNNYYKALRMEKTLFWDNLLSIFFVLVLLSAIYSVVRNTIVVATLSFVAIYFRYIISKIKLDKKFGFKKSFFDIEDVILVVFAILTSISQIWTIGLIVNAVMIIVYTMAKKNEMVLLIKTVR